MAESLTSQTVIGVSTAPESSYGTHPVLASNYTPMVVRTRDLPVPESEKLDDRGVVGRGNAMYPSYQRSGFRVPTAFEMSDVMNVGTLCRLLRRYMGKTAATPTTVEAAIAFLHTFYEADPDVEGLQLPSSSIIYQNNEFDYIHRGCVGSTFQAAQTGTADPTYTLGIAGHGNPVRVSSIGGFGTLPVPGQDPYMYGPSTSSQYTDATPATVSLTTTVHKWRGATFTANNNLDTGDTRAGMPQADPTEPKRGWYRDFLHFGDREVSLEWTMGMDSSYTLKDAEELNTIYTNFTWQMNGDVIPTTASANKYYAKLVIPKFNIRTPRTGEESNKRTKTFTVFPLIHAAHYGVYRFEIQNGVSTAIS